MPMQRNRRKYYSFKQQSPPSSSDRLSLLYSMISTYLFEQLIFFILPLSSPLQYFGFALPPPPTTTTSRFIYIHICMYGINHKRIYDKAVALNRHHDVDPSISQNHSLLDGYNSTQTNHHQKSTDQNRSILLWNHQIVKPVSFPFILY